MKLLKKLIILNFVTCCTLYPFFFVSAMKNDDLPSITLPDDSNSDKKTKDKVFSNKRAILNNIEKIKSYKKPNYNTTRKPEILLNKNSALEKTLVMKELGSNSLTPILNNDFDSETISLTESYENKPESVAKPTPTPTPNTKDEQIKKSNKLKNKNYEDIRYTYYGLLVYYGYKNKKEYIEGYYEHSNTTCSFKSLNIPNNPKISAISNIPISSYRKEHINQMHNELNLICLPFVKDIGDTIVQINNINCKIKDLGVYFENFLKNNYSKFIFNNKHRKFFHEFVKMDILLDEFVKNKK